MKKVGIICVALICICAVILLRCGNNPIKRYLEKKKVENAVKDDQQSIVAINKVLGDTTTHKLINDTVHAIQNVAVGTSNQLETVPIVKDAIKKRAKSLNINSNQIDNMSTSSVSVTGSILSNSGDITFTTLSGEKDTTYHKPFDDGFLHADLLTSKPIDSARLNYNVHFREYSTLYYEQRHLILLPFWKIGKPRFKQDIYTDCPNVHIDSISVIKVQKGFK